MKNEATAGGWRDFLPLGTVLIAGLVIAISVFGAVRGYYQTLDRQQFRRNATNYGTSFRDDVTRHVTSLAAIRAFVSASREVTRWEFSTYAHQILPQNLGFKAVLWVPSVPKAARAAYEAELQKDGLYGLRIRELTDRGQIIAARDHATYLPISYVEPFDGNDTLVGLDLSGLRDFGGLFRDARNTGHIAVSAPLTQTLIAGTHGPAILLAFPLSPDAANSAAAVAGVKPPKGYALGILQLQALIDEAVGSSPATVQAAIAYQQDARKPPLVYGGGGAQSLDTWFKGAAFQQTVPFNIADRHFLLVLRATASADPATDLYAPACAALLVLALAALLAQSMSTTVLRTRQVERAVVARTAQLRAANESLQGEIEQRRQAEAQLRVARDRAESANRAKSSFMATMSHELRTPLNAIIGFSSILAQGNAGEARNVDYAHEILGSGQRLLGLINDILDVTQMDSGPQDANTLVYLSDIIASVVAQAEPVAREAGITLTDSVADGLPALHGDDKRLTKALRHLLVNALKFTPRGGAAVVAARLDGQNHLIVEVTDTGVGMPPDAGEKIRQIFSQYDGRLGRKYEGVGLGLTYVGKVAELHDAAIEIVSEAGKGTCVRLTFPVHRIARAQEVA